MIKARIAGAIFFTQPDYNKPFVIYPSASNKYAMRGMLAQDRKMISIFLQKINNVQLKYPVGEQEFLAAHELARYFELIACGYKLFIQTVHQKKRQCKRH